MPQIANNPSSRVSASAIASVIHAISPLVFLQLSSPPHSYEPAAMLAVIAVWSWPIWFFILRRNRASGVWAFRNPLVIGLVALVPALPFALLYTLVLVGGRVG